MFKIDQVTHAETVSVDAAGNYMFEIAVPLPVGAQGISCAWDVFDPAVPEIGYTFHIFKNCPSEDGSEWVFRGLWGNATTIDVTLTVTYMQLS